MQEPGIATPSTTTIDGRVAIRAALVDHHMQRAHVMQVIDAELSGGRAWAATERRDNAA